MKKTISLALLAFAFFAACTLEAKPPNLRTSQECVISDAGFESQTPFVITQCHVEDFNTVILVENLQYVSNNALTGVVCVNKKALNAILVTHFSGFVIKPPLCISSLGNYKASSFKVYTGNRSCFIRNPSYLIC